MSSSQSICQAIDVVVIHFLGAYSWREVFDRGSLCNASTRAISTGRKGQWPYTSAQDGYFMLVCSYQCVDYFPGDL